ncbi:MAG: glycogen debranching protein GlgX [Longimicrobiales bacterium]
MPGGDASLAPVRPGRSFPLGATYDGRGVNFAVFSEHATGVEVCLFDDDGREQRAPLREVSGHVWHGYVDGIQPGQLYGYRVHGPHAPLQGHRFNPAKLLIDPYARALAGTIDWSAPLFGYPPGNVDADLALDDADSAHGVPKGVVISEDYDWEGDALLDTPWHETVIYETHVKGLTARHPEVRPELRGTYAGLACAPIIEYLVRLGISAVELLPVHAFVDEKHLVDRGLRNYWGYNSINFFAPDARYASAGDRGGQVREFRDMVKALHRAGIEVIVDVVYNHTAEGNQLGPTLSFRGLDNASYYRLVPDQPRFYMDYTGTGNSFNAHNPQVLKLIMDSLRYWVTAMHVDGFRFDLASTLARELHDVNRLSSFFDTIHQDPVLSRVKLIAEPWDLGEGGYQVGNFPVLWGEWNDRYRDGVRRFWREDAGQLAELGLRLTGSSDLYSGNGRSPYASINYVTSHDGFTLQDLVSYEERHNEANGDDNRDGHENNLSRNYGVEGPTEDPAIIETRERQKRNLLATLFFSQGVPMLLGGDEICRTQRGNNNAYAQDNEISWYDWTLAERAHRLLDFTRGLIRIRREHPSLRRRKFFRDRRIRGEDVRDIIWLQPNGREMTDDEWSGDMRAIGVHLAGEALDERDHAGNALTDDTLLLLLNAYPEPIPFQLPATAAERPWSVLVDTADPSQAGAPEGTDPHDFEQDGSMLVLAPRSVVLLRREPG